MPPGRARLPGLAGMAAPSLFDMKTQRLTMIVRAGVNPGPILGTLLGYTRG